MPWCKPPFLQGFDVINRPQHNCPKPTRKSAAGTLRPEVLSGLNLSRGGVGWMAAAGLSRARANVHAQLGAGSSLVSTQCMSRKLPYRIVLI